MTYLRNKQACESISFTWYLEPNNPKKKKKNLAAVMSENKISPL